MAMLEESMPLCDAIVAQTFGSLTAEELEGLAAAIAHLNRIVDGLEVDAGFRQAPGHTRAVKNGG